MVLLLAMLIVGAVPPGIVSVILSRVHEILPADAHAQTSVWNKARTVFALFQALAGYGSLICSHIATATADC
jgi:hypothetical protein